MSARKEIERKLSNALTVRELIEELQVFPDDCRVVFACDYGDHSHTQQALPVQTASEIQDGEETVVKSAYSQSGLAIDSVEDPDEDDETFDVVVLR